MWWLGRSLPKVEKVKVYDNHAEQVPRFMELVNKELKNIEILPCTTVEETVKEADVVVTCTPIVNDPERFVRSEWLKKDMLAVAVDYDSAFEADVMSEASALCAMTLTSTSGPRSRALLSKDPKNRYWATWGTFAPV